MKQRSSSKRSHPKVSTYASELKRLHAIAAGSRLRAIESQLSLAFTMCALAETELRYQQPGEAFKLLDKVRNTAESIRIHLGEPNHVPKPSISHLRKHLRRLEIRIRDVEALLYEIGK